MKIIDTKTGKRVGQDVKATNKKLKEEDPILVNATKSETDSEFSPMDPPEAYEVDKANEIAKEDMHPLIQQYMDEHVAALEIVDQFEKGLLKFKEDAYALSDEVNSAFKTFFDFFDSSLLDHNRREERELFPLLHKRLIESGEHGTEAENPTTAIDMMEDDHVKFIQLGSLTFNMLGLAARIGDPGSKAFTNDVAFNNGQELIETLRLHIFREDTVLFPLAHNLISKEEMDAMKP
jgi:iron-sulfur cluster repair protein YtfE (RIC family)